MQSIDIVVPCYNYSRYLRECVDSILGQDGCLIRILIIDDASSDGSVEVARDLAARDSRVELSIHADNKGHIKTYNEGIAWARQTYFLLLSADDLLAPGALKRAADLLDANPGVAFVHGRAITFWGGVPPIKTDVASTPPRIVPGPQFIANICANPVNPVTTATAVVRTSVQKKVGLYKHALPHAGDLEMWLRCAMYGDVGEIYNIQGFRRMHDSNMCMLYAADGLMIRDFTQRYQAFQIFFAEHDHDLNDGEQLRTSANYQLADQIIDEAREQFRKKRLYSSFELLQLAFRVAPAIFLNSRWWLRVARWFWRRAGRILAGVCPRY
ncbi:glycosyltransferase family A protein [Bradyrhizobium sp.]|uniref:glycosyltransferase family 2 protein n=1 Tax=Bradyrhizobium sp. TaxID=376 RepID=UPI0025BE1B2A|nr:glycosyltransferase family A protein [Bradyrhizobium sp.]